MNKYSLPFQPPILIRFTFDTFLHKLSQSFALAPMAISDCITYQPYHP